MRKKLSWNTAVPFIVYVRTVVVVFQQHSIARKKERKNDKEKKEEGIKERKEEEKKDRKKEKERKKERKIHSIAGNDLFMLRQPYLLA